MISTKNLSILLILSVIFLYEAQATTQVWSTVSGADGIAVDTLGNIFVSSTSGNVVYQLYEGFGTPVKFAGTGAAGHVDGNAFTEAQFNQPRGIAINDMGDIYVADYGNNAIRVISEGVVSTLVNNVPSPVDVSIVGTEGQYDSSYNYYYYYWYNTPNFVNPWGVYVTSESGTVYFVNEGPANDDCPFAVPVTLSPNPVVLHGTTVRAHGETFVPPCPVGTNTVPLNPAWYIFTGNGNQVNISTCAQSQSGYTQVFVYRDETPSSTQCSDLFCMGENYHSGLCGTVTICTQQGMRYYVVVSSPYESYEGTFQLTITDLGASACSSCTCNGVQCGTDPCGGYCSNSTACTRGQGCVDSQCVRQAANAYCTGSTAIVGNATVSGNTEESFGSAPFIASEGNCYFPQNSGLWYSFVGTGTYVSLTTCSPNTNFDTIVHVYENMYPEYPCDEFLCISTSDDFYCNGKSMYSKNDFCSQANTTYYYFVEGAGHGDFELTQTVSTTECTPGDYWPYWHYYYFSSTTFWYDEE